MVTGSLLATASMVWLTRLDLDSSYLTHILPSFIGMSVGMGLVFVPLSSTALSGVGNHDAGVASAMVNTTQQVGASLGTALLNTIFTTAVAGYATTHGRTPLALAHGAIHGYNVAFSVSAGLLAVAAVLALLFIRKPAESAPADSAETEQRVVPEPVLVH
jgi:MFS family permease